MLKGIGLMAAVVALTGGYSVFGERYWLQTKQVTLTFPKLPKEFSGMHMVHFSDVHLGKYYKKDRLEGLVAEIMKQKPDLICFTGDLFDTHDGDTDEAIIPILAKLDAPYGKFAVVGNHDHASGIEEVKSILSNSGFRVLINEHEIVEHKGQSICIAGVDDMFLGKPSIQKAMQGSGLQDGIQKDGLQKDGALKEGIQKDGALKDDLQSGLFTLLLSHAPDFADKVGQFPVDLQISGHSHGGQVRLPFVGALTTPRFGRIYVQGLNKVK